MPRYGGIMPTVFSDGTVDYLKDIFFVFPPNVLLKPGEVLCP